MAVAFLISAVALMVTVQHYKQQTHDTKEQIASTQYMAFMSEVSKLCNVTESKGPEHDQSCKQAQEFIESIATISDLNAQQTMAVATRGILLSSWFQILVSAFALALVGVTLYATWEMLGQAASTTEYARQTLDAANKTTDITDDSLAETRKANILALRPYFEILSADLEKVKTHIPPEYFAMRFIVNIKNIGETQATGLKLEITSVHGIGSFPTARLNPFIGHIGIPEKIWNFDMGRLHGSNLNTRPPEQELLSRGESQAFGIEVTFKVEGDFPIDNHTGFSCGAEDILGISHIEARFDGTIEFNDLKPDDRRVCEFSVFLYRETNEDNGEFVQASPVCRITSDRYRSEREGK